MVTQRQHAVGVYDAGGYDRSFCVLRGGVLVRCCEVGSPTVADEVVDEVAVGRRRVDRLDDGRRRSTRSSTVHTRSTVDDRLDGLDRLSMDSIDCRRLDRLDRLSTNSVGFKYPIEIPMRSQSHGNFNSRCDLIE